MRRRFRLSLLVVLIALVALPPVAAFVYSKWRSEVALQDAKEEMIRDLPFNDLCVLTPLNIRQKQRSLPWGRSSDREAVLHVHLTAPLCQFDSEHSLFYVFHDPAPAIGQGAWYLAPYDWEEEGLRQDLFAAPPTAEDAAAFERACEARIESPELPGSTPVLNL